jgi:hypothetical protein
MKQHLTALATCLLVRATSLVILADDIGYGDVGCFGAKDIRTPHLDKMASEGLRLTSFYAQPICGPSRAALDDGLLSHPHRRSEERQERPHAAASRRKSSSPRCCVMRAIAPASWANGILA